MEIKEAIEILKGIEQRWVSSSGRRPNDKETIAITIVNNFLSKISDAEMPRKKIKLEGEYCCNRCATVGYNQCHYLWLPYYLKKMSERVDVEIIEGIIADKVSGCKGVTCGLCVKIIKELAQAIAKEIGKE